MKVFWCGVAIGSRKLRVPALPRAGCRKMFPQSREGSMVKGAANGHCWAWGHACGEQGGARVTGPLSCGSVHGCVLHRWGHSPQAGCPSRGEGARVVRSGLRMYTVRSVRAAPSFLRAPGQVKETNCVTTFFDFSVISETF